MPADAVRVQAAVRTHLESGDLATLFLTDLGWDAPDPAVRLADGSASARKIAEKRGVGVWVVSGADAAAVDRLDRQIEQQSHERLVVVEGADGLTWQWPERRRSGYVSRSHLPQRTRGEVADIVQRLAALRFEPGEDRDVTVLDVRDRVRRSFDTDKVDEAFFKDFKDCHELIGGKSDGTAAGAITGISSNEDRRWYASVLLNRLMFLYFLQKKGFLDNDTDYLRNRLASTTGPQRRRVRGAPARVPLRHTRARRGLPPGVLGLRRVPLAPRRSRQRLRRRDQPRHPRAHLRAVREPEGDGRLLHAGRRDGLDGGGEHWGRPRRRAGQGWR